MMTRPISYCHGDQAFGHFGPSMHPRPRGGLMGGAVILTGVYSQGVPTGYGYLGMDITMPSSWPRPYCPQQTSARFVRWGT